MRLCRLLLAERVSQSLTMYMKPSSRTIWMMRKMPASTLAICRWRSAI